jgi:hypothetical protein
LPPNTERAALEGSPNAISTVLAKPADIATTAKDIQAVAVMPKPCEPFDYGEVAPDIATALRAQASRIRDMVTVTTSAVIQIGNDLIAVKLALESGKFRRWIESECGFSVRTAENYMGAARLAEGRNATVAFLQPATVYRLAAKSAPVEIVNAVLQRVGQGETVSDRDITAALDLARVQRRQVAVAEKRKARAPSKRTQAKWEQQRLAQREMDDMAAQQRREAIAGLIEVIGLNNARLVIETLQGSALWEKFDELKRACEATGGGRLA